ncbi:MAG: nucleotidyltransferase family protein [Anaerolineae bacterium]|nr:nucleotidyltransferase family protein [Anaerolineae bacterium]
MNSYTRVETEREHIRDGLLHFIQRIAERRGTSLGADWDWVVEDPDLRSLLPLIHYAFPDDALPLSDAARQRCAQAYYHTASRNTLIYQELSRVLDILGASPPIPVILIKGSALALTLYPNIGLRPMSDVDMLVPEDRLDEAVERLQASGYTRPVPEMVPGLNRLVGHHVGLTSSGKAPLYVEVHWTLVAGRHGRYTPSMEWFWSHTEPVSMGDATKPRTGPSLPDSPLTLSPTAHLPYLAAHLMLQHGEARSQTLWFYDIDLMIRRWGGRIDWDDLLQHAQEFRWAAALHAALRGVRERFGTPLPERVLDRLDVMSDEESARLVRRKATPWRTRLPGVLNTMAAMSWTLRLRLIAAHVLPSPTYMRWRYKPQPTWLWPLTYPYRWLDILRDGVSTALDRAPGKHKAPERQEAS